MPKRALALIWSLISFMPSLANAAWPPDGLVVAPIPVGAQVNVHLLARSDGRVLVYWQDQRHIDPGDLYAQLVTPTGLLAPGWPDTGRMIARAPDYQQPAIGLVLPNGSFLLGTFDGRGFEIGTTRFDAYLSKVLADIGPDPAWPAHGYQITAARFDEYPQRMVWAAPDTLVMATMHGIPGPTDTSHQVMLQRVAVGAGPPLVQWDPAGRVVARRRELLDIGLVADGASGVFTMFHDLRSTTSPDHADCDVYLLRLDRNGEAMPGWPTAGLAVALAPGLQWHGALCEDGAGGVYLAWSDARAGAALPFPDVLEHQDVRLLRLGPDGTPRPGWPADGVVVCDAAGEQQSHSVLPDGQGGVFITWDDWRPEFTPGGGTFSAMAVMVSHVRGDGSLFPGWPEDGLRVNSLFGVSYNQQMVLDGSGGLYVKRSDFGLSSLFLQHVQSNGTLNPSWPAEGHLVAANDPEISGTWLESDHQDGCYVAYGQVEPGALFQHVRLKRYSPDGVVDTELAEVVVEASSVEVRLSWQGTAVDGGALKVERVEGVSGTWAEVGLPSQTQAGRAEYVDREVRAGVRYGWRLARQGGEVVSREAWATVPGPLRFALEPARPNPIVSGELRARFTLAEPGAVRLEVYDVTGRREFSSELRGLEPGPHELPLADAKLAPGLHWLRLTQGARTARVRVAVVR